MNLYMFGCSRSSVKYFDPCWLLYIGWICWSHFYPFLFIQREEEAIQLDGLNPAQVKEIREKAEKHMFQAEVNRMMKLIINSLYKNKEVSFNHCHANFWLISNIWGYVNWNLCSCTKSIICYSKPKNIFSNTSQTFAKEEKLLDACHLSASIQVASCQLGKYWIRPWEFPNLQHGCSASPSNQQSSDHWCH